MERYFIKFEDIINNNILNKKFDIYSDDLKIKKKTKNGKNVFQNITVFNNYSKDLIQYSRGLDCNSILMVELTKEESELYDPLFIRKYKSLKGNIYEEVDSKTQKIELINYNGIIKMTDKELSKGLIVSILPKKSDAKSLLKNNNSNKRVMEVENKNIIKYSTVREDIVKSGVGCDLYFYTKDEDLKSFYNDDIIEVETEEDYQVKITKHKLFIMDKITQRDRDELAISTFLSLNGLIEKSMPIKKEYNDSYYDFKLCKYSDEARIGYLLDEDYLRRLLYTDCIRELFPFITVYVLENGIYNKMNLHDYLYNKETIKYIKKADKK
ncbi:MAG: hypothetical protein IJD92_02680 [Bacilli bacterium]|nr:hypothetical protein [Bacilli bacterium]